MKRKNIVFILTVLIIAILIASVSIFITYKQSQKEISINLLKTRSNPAEMSSTTGEKTTLSTFIEMSTDCFIGKFVSYKDYENITEYEFAVTEKVFGESEDKTVRIRIQYYGASPEGNIRRTTFTEGHEYLLLVSKSESLFLEYPWYSFMGYIVMDFNDLSKTRWGEGKLEITEGASKLDIINHIKTLADKTTIRKTDNIKIFRTEDEETVIKNCDLVLKIKSRMLIADGVYEERSTYFCEVSECLKGDYSTNQDGMVIISTFKDALDGGKECIIALSNTASDICYDQASPICIFDADDSEMETKIKGWLSEKNVP